MLTSPSSSGSSRSRTGVATQACETCRRRKSKCDERRPKCTLCERLNLDCHYKESEQGRKDESMAHVLEALQRVEKKLDNMSAANSPNLTPTPSQSPLYHPQNVQGSRESLPERLQHQMRPHLTIPHKIILWPTIYSELVKVIPQVGPDLQAMFEDGTPWLLKQEIGRQDRALPFNEGLPSALAANVPPGQSFFTSRVTFPSLTMEDMKRFTDAYFNTYNVVYPILDYGLFINGTLEPVIRIGFGYGDSASVLVLMVLALGSLAVAAVTGMPLNDMSEPSSGVPRSMVRNPPGLQLFNEARARIGSIDFRCDLVNVQIQILIATYFEANGCHVEFWRSTVSASMICQVLIRSTSIQWNSLQGDILKRAYWTCVVNEDLYHLDLDLSRTTIYELEDTVPLPHFDSTQSRSNPPVGKGTEVEETLQYYFLSKISLKRMISRIHEGVYLHSNQSETLDDYRGPPVHVIRELSRQLESWRTLLPSTLQWSDEETKNAVETVRGASVDPSLFTRNFDEAAIQSARSVLTAELRARFYYARYILYRPFIFKALHFPQLMHTQDEEYCAFALEAACLWPATLAPAKNKKCLIPHLFTWTQNFIGVLLILWVAQSNKCLHQICRERLDGRTIEVAVALMLQWIKDVRHIDRIAEWSLGLLEPLFSPVA